MNQPLYIPLPSERGQLKTLMALPSLEATIFDARLFYVHDPRHGVAGLVFGPDAACAQGLAAAYWGQTAPLPCGLSRSWRELKAEPVTLELYAALSRETSRLSLCLARVIRGKTTAIANLFARPDRRNAISAFIKNELCAKKPFLIGATLLNRCPARTDGIRVYAGPLPLKNPPPKREGAQTATQRRRAQRGRPPLPGSVPVHA